VNFRFASDLESNNNAMALKDILVAFLCMLQKFHIPQSIVSKIQAQYFLDHYNGILNEYDNASGLIEKSIFQIKKLSEENSELRKEIWIGVGFSWTPK
jgi:hypothetical protein